MRLLDLFSGIGGFSLAAEWAGFEVVGQVEIDPFCNRVLEKHWPNVKRMRDIKEVKGDEFGPVDLLCGGPPCQPASCAGKRTGTEDDRWLWEETIRLVGAIKPSWCLFENPTGILSLQGGLPFESLLLNLEEKDYTIQAFVLPAASIGAPHRRDRVWIVAHSTREGLSQSRPTEIGELQTEETKRLDDRLDQSDCHAPHSNRQGPQIREMLGRNFREELQTPIRNPWQEHWYEAATRLCRMDARLPQGMDRVNRLKALGNSIVPQIALQIFNSIKELENSEKNL